MENWHISKSISIGHIVTTCVIVISVIAYISSVEHSIHLNTVKIKSNKELVMFKDKNLNITLNRIDKRFDQLDKRLETITNILLKQIRK